MSITPFLPGLPAPVPTDPGAPATGDPGELGVVFGDALAAALLATVPLPTTPVAVPTAPGAAVAPAAAQVAAAPLVAAAIAPVVAPATAPGSPTPEPAPAPAEEPVASAPTTPAPPAAPKVPAPGTAAVVEVRGRPRPSLETTGSDAGSQSLANLPASSPEVSRLVAGAPHTSTAGTPTVERAVVQQVFPEVTRLVTSTPTDRPGTHRITLTLQPEQLGEVRVTLVVKDGAVQVRLAGNANDPAGSAAVHRALSAGVPELQRLLERSGATEARVLVRDPFSPTSPQPTAPSAPVAATSQTSGSTVSADAGRDGASTWDRSSGDPDQRRHRRDVPEPPPLAPVPTVTTTATTPAGQLDRTL